jgi:toluene monooxygenase system ferredoxin subunit
MTWTKVCEKSDIPEGSIKKVWARIGGGIPIAVAHHKRGFVAIPPVCPHLEEPLEESGLVMGCKLTCTKHLWSWDLETLELQDEAELPLKTYDVKVEGSNIMVYVTEQLEYNFDEDEDIDENTFFDEDDDDDDEW